MSWTPKLLVAAGLSAQQGITGGVLLSVGGIFGAALIGGLASRWPLTRVLSLFMLITAGLLVLFVGSGSSIAAALGLGLLIGLFSNGCVAGLYALSPVVYDASVRATGVGWGIGIGRIGAILSPIVAGFLLDGGWQPLHLYGVFASVFVLAAGCLLLLKPGATQVQPTLSHAQARS
jgi:MFS family permease